MGAKIFLVLWNITALAVTAIFAARARALGRRLRAIERTPTTSVATAPREGVVEIVGLVVAGPNGTFRSPLDSFDAVYMRLLLEEDESSTRRTLVDEVTAVPFYVDDGSGRALVEPDRAVVETNASGHLPEFRDRALAELVRRGKEFRPDRVLWKQFVIRPGDLVYVLGRASSRTEGVVASGYRAGPGSTLVVSAPPPDSPDELVIGVGGQQVLVAGLEGQKFTATVVVIVVVVISILIDIVMQLL